MELSMTNKLSNKSKFSLMFGTGGMTLVSTFIAYFAMIYFTDVLGISPAAAGTLIIIARLWDAVNDPMAGILIDRTHTKIGKARPYLKYAPLFYAIFAVLLFVKPNFSDSGKLAWAYFTYIGYGMSLTVVQMAILTLIPRMAVNTVQKTTLSSFYFIGASVCGVIASFAAMPLVNMLGGGDPSKGYMMTSIAFAGIGLIALWVCYANVREIQSVEETKEKYSFKVIVKSILKNKPFIILAVIGLVFGIGGGLFGGSLVYYLIYYMKRPDLIPVFMPTYFLMTIVASLVSSFVIKKLGNKNTILIFGLISACLMLVRFVTNDASATVMLLVVGAAGITVGLLNVATVSGLTDTIIYGHYKTGVKLESVMMSANTFNAKMGIGLGTGLLGYMLEISGYVANAGVQTESALNMLFHANVTAYMVAFAVSAVVILFYPLTTNKVKEMEVELKQR